MCVCFATTGLTEQWVFTPLAMQRFITSVCHKVAQALRVLMYLCLRLSVPASVHVFTFSAYVCTCLCVGACVCVCLYVYVYARALSAHVLAMTPRLNPVPPLTFAQAETAKR